MPVPRVIVIGASAGGVQALRRLVDALPADLPAAVFVVLHVPPSGESRLPDILNRSRSLPAAHASDGERVQAGRIYVARPDRHLLLDDGYVRVVHGPRQNMQRPAIDPLFRSAALAYGTRAIGLVLTGALDDGTVGLKAIVDHGGIGIVQDPRDADMPDMPRSALEHAKPDLCLPLSQIGPVLTRLVLEAPPDPPAQLPEMSSISEESAMAIDEQVEESADRLGVPSAFTCPECHGTLWELEDGDVLRYRCRVGHAYTEGTMTQAHARSVERSLWVAVRCLQENASLQRRLAARFAQRQSAESAERFRRRADDMARHAADIRRMLLEVGHAAADAPEPSPVSNGSDFA